MFIIAVGKANWITFLSHCRQKAISFLKFHIYVLKLYFTGAKALISNSIYCKSMASFFFHSSSLPPKSVFCSYRIRIRGIFVFIFYTWEIIATKELYMLVIVLISSICLHNRHCIYLITAFYLLIHTYSTYKKVGSAEEFVPFITVRWDNH